MYFGKCGFTLFAAEVYDLALFAGPGSIVRQDEMTAYSQVMKLMNSDTHSCTSSLASFEILAFFGRFSRIILAMFAMGRKRL